MKIITFNIQGGFKIDQVCREVEEKIGFFDLLCLQEVCESPKIKNHAQQIAEFLGKDYASKSFLPIDFKIKNMGNAFVFNKKVLRLIDSFGLVLPSFKPNLSWRSIGKIFPPCDRLCHIGFFKTKQGKIIKVSNFHLEFIGGSTTRKKQVDFFLKNSLNPDKPDLEFILGDFNTTGSSKKASAELKLLEKKGFVELSKKITWTSSPSNPDPAWKKPYQLLRIAKIFSPLLRTKTDYIFSKGEPRQAQCSAINFSSTDHRAVILNFSL
ncbi:MAG TPA: hypothetical protein VMY36_02650 [Patescibacteria group bacterium]|nr:hypothetical protein [Patescibacteria group bacterium]